MKEAILERSVRGTDSIRANGGAGPLRLDANEGRCVLSAAQLSLLFSPELARRYPRSAELEAGLATSLGVEAEDLIATAGADDAIDRALRCLAGPGGLVAGTSPGFVEFLDATRRSGATFMKLSKEPSSPFPIGRIADSVEERRPAVLIIASPDNPSGRSLSGAEFDALSGACERAGTILLLDLTYQDFAETEDLFPRALEKLGVLITGSFSKSKGLAGFRIGWAAAGKRSRGLIERLRSAGPPFSLSSPAIEAALMALGSDPGLQASFVARIRVERRELQNRLSRIGARTWPSEANFVTAKVPDPRSFAAFLKDRGILVRTWPDSEDAADLVRITCPGEEGEFRRLSSAIDAMGALTWQ